MKYNKRKKKTKNKKMKGGCLPCLAAAGPPGIAVATVGTVGYAMYKKRKGRLTKKQKKKKKKYQSGGTLDDLPLDLINDKLKTMNCLDRLSYCQTNRKSRNHCNSEPTLSKYIMPCRKKSKLNKTKKKVQEVSRRLQQKNRLKEHKEYIQKEIQEQEAREERELFERLRQPRNITINEDLDEDLEFDD